MGWAYRRIYSNMVPVMIIITIMFGAVIHSVSSIEAVSDSPNCHQSERRALLSFKHHLTDPSDRLSSWVVGGTSCCSWHGVVCDNLTGHVLELHLRGPFSIAEYWDRIDERDKISKLHWLGGKLDNSLLDLKYLRYLDLSNNDFGGISVPLFVGSMHSLTYLNLSAAGFGGEIPSQLGNLSNLLSLAITDTGYGIQTKNLGWLSGLSMLRYLDFSHVMLPKASDALQGISALPLLEELHLKGCGLEDISHFPDLNFSKLVTLDFSSNRFGSFPSGLDKTTSLKYLDLSSCSINTTFPKWLYKFSHLEKLMLGGNHLQGTIADDIANLTFLNHLDLSHSNISGPIPDALGSLNSLLRLDLSYNQLNGTLPQAICQLQGLRDLNLGNNLLSGAIPESLGSLSSLESLVLSGNKLSGTLPASLGKLIQLETLDVSFNSFEGILSPIFFANLTRLSTLIGSANRIRLQVSPYWIPPLQLKIVQLASWYLGPKFPKWLSSLDHLEALDISNAGIEDRVPGWFVNVTSKLTCLDMANNHLHGEILEMALSWYPWNFVLLDLSNNSFSGHLSSLICAGKKEVGLVVNSSLSTLHLGNNNLFGEIPDCWSNWPNLVSIELQNNNLTGTLPESLGHLNSLNYLHLRNNSLSGVLPSSLQNCTELTVFDIAHNKLSGILPKWIGQRLSSLRIITLGSNYFHGYIPNELCALSFLVILDMGHNNLSGAIPKCFVNFQGMAKQSISDFPSSSDLDIYKEESSYDQSAILVTKASVLEYSKNLRFMTAIDLSNNSLSGSIPEGITNLVALLSLNLSGNSLTGKIPENMGNMLALESLDLSMNRLSGEIPESMASMTYLEFLNVSFNDLMGRIPTSTQIQSFNASSFIGNKLCGPPVSPICGSDKSVPSKKHGDNQHHGLEFDEFFVSFSLGYVVSLGAVIAPLLYSSAWRIHYFGWLHSVWDRLLVWTAILFHTRA